MDKRFQPHTEGHKQKISFSLKGRPHSLEHNKKVSEALKGHKKTAEHLRKIADAQKGKIISEETKRKMSLVRKGKKIHSTKIRKIMSEQKKGEKNPNWKGGVSPKNELIRDSLEYKLWRSAVFKRDNYTCIWCGQIGGNLKPTILNLLLIILHLDLQ